MKTTLYATAPVTLTHLPLGALKKTVKALFKKIKRLDIIVTTQILKKEYAWFRATDKDSWLKIYQELLDRNENLDKDIVKIKHTRFAHLLKVLNNKNIFKTTETEIIYFDYECGLSLRWTNRRGDISNVFAGCIGYSTWKCKYYFKQLKGSKEIYFNSAKEMITVVLNCASKLA